MTITQTLRQKGTLFSKQTKIIHFTEVTPADAPDLAFKLRHLFSQYGDDSNYEIYIDGVKIGGVKIRGSDHWKSRDDRDHFLFGLELGMSISGVDVTPS